MKGEIARALAPVARRVRLRRLAGGFSRGALAGAACAVLVALISFFLPIERAYALAAALALAVCALFCAVGALRPVRLAQAACVADACGLKERVSTALECADAGPMASLLHKDALRALGGTDFRRALAVRWEKKPLLLTLGLVALIALSAFLPNPQDAVLRDRARFAGEMEEVAQRAEAGAEELDAALYTPEELAALRRALSELARDLRASADAREAYEAIDRARRTSEEERAAGRERAGEALSAALGEAGLSGAQALASGEEEEIAQALENMDARQAAQSLAQAAGALSGAQADAVRAAANAMLGGDVPGAAAALARASAGVPGDMDSLLRALSAALASGQNSGAQSSGAGSQDGAGEGSDGNDGGQGENGSGAGSGAGESGSGSGSGAGSGQGEGESGSGAGQGSTNEQQGGAGNPGGAQGAGDGAMRYQQGTYETIYDPTRLDAAGESSQLTGEMGEGESQSVDLGFGEGEEGGDVPVGEYAGEYAQAAARAAEAENLPDSLKTYVDEYFSSLTGGDGREP